MKVIICNPNHKARVEEIDGSLETLQEIVQGNIEAIYPFKDEVALVCNDEGKINCLEPNRVLLNMGKPVDIVCGSFFLCGIGKEDFTDMPEELIDKYKHLMNQLSCYWISKKAAELEEAYSIVEIGGEEDSEENNEEANEETAEE